MPSRRLFCNSKKNGINIDYYIYYTQGEKRVLLWAKENKDRRTKDIKYKIFSLNYKTKKILICDDYNNELFDFGVIKMIEEFWLWLIKKGVFIKYFKGEKINW